MSGKLSLSVKRIVRPRRKSETKDVTHRNLLRHYFLYTEKRITGGTDGDVCLGTDTITGTVVVVKKLKRTSMEMVVSTAVGPSRKHCIQVLNVFEERGQSYIVTAYAANGDLYDNIFTKLDHMGLDSSLLYFAQMIRGVKELHDLRIAHCDIKLENVFIDKQGVARLGDFGRACFFNDAERKVYQPGTLYYSAPETISGTKVIGPEIDVWSLGVCLYTMITGYFPFSGTNRQEIFDHIQRKKYRQSSIDAPLEIIDLLKLMLTINPKNRMTVDELLEYPYLQPFYDKLDNKDMPLSQKSSLRRSW